MPDRVKAVYREGQIVLLEAADLKEGDEIAVIVPTHRERLRAAMSDILMTPKPPQNPVDEEMLFRLIDEGFRGQKPLSEDIIEARRTGP